VPAQGLVNHVAQRLVNHADECGASDLGLTSLFKPNPMRLWHGLAIDREHNSGGEIKSREADGGVRQIELHREGVILRRAVHGMRMAVNIRVCDFRGVAMRATGDGQSLVLIHRDPSLSIPLCVSADSDEIATAWQMWSDIFALPQLTDETREPAPRRRRRNAIRARRPKFLVRRRIGGPLNAANSHRGEREIIARH
jgi:hypothetical protein